MSLGARGRALSPGRRASPPSSPHPTALPRAKAGPGCSGQPAVGQLSRSATGWCLPGSLALGSLPFVMVAQAKRGCVSGPTSFFPLSASRLGVALG